jgi:RHS repeat-associated protein
MNTNSDLRKTILKAAVRVRRAAITKTSVMLLLALATLSLSLLDSRGSTPLAVSPGAPAGSYALNDLESVNLYNGHLSFALPLLRIGGRGGAGYVMTLPMGALWQTVTQVNCFPDPANPDGETCITLYYPVQAGSSAGFLPASLTVEPQERREYAGQTLSLQTLTTMNLTLPDGTQYELRDERTNGKPFTGFYNRFNLQPERGFLRGSVYSTHDGSKIYFISDTEIHDFFPHPQSPDFSQTSLPTGFLLMPDGTRYRFVNGRLIWIRDIHGNEMTFTYVTNGFTVRDSLNRSVTVELNVNDVQPFGLCHRITYYGFATSGGGSIVEDSKRKKGPDSAPPRIIRVSLRPLSQQLRQATAQGSSAYSLSNARDLFPGLDGVNTPYNPMLTSAVWLPDGRKFSFRYNSYAELARVELPTGGAYEYDITGGLPGGTESGVTLLEWAERRIYRRLIERRVYADGTTLEGKTVYSKPSIPSQTSQQGPTEVVTLTPAGVPLTRGKHYFHGNVLSSLSTNFIWEMSRYAPWKEGHEFKTEMYDAGPDLQTSGPLLKMVENTWEQRPVFDWFGSSLSSSAPANDPRIAESRTTLVDTGQVTRKVFKYSDDPAFNNTTDTFNNLTDTFEYDFGASQAGPLLRHTHTDFLKANPANNLDYTNLTPNLHIITLPRLITISDGGEVPVAKQEILYDEPDQPLIQNGTSIPGWVAPETIAQGNATTVRVWLNVGDRWIETHARYDQVGNVRFSWDGKGNKTELIFGPEYAFAYQTAAKTPVPDPSGANASALELTSSFTYDLNSGSKTVSIDANGQVISGEYIDPLDRMTRVNRPSGGGWTNIAYGDTVGNLFVRTETALDAARSLQSYTFFDGLGRAVRSFTSEDDGWIGVETQYDALGRAVRTSNPYRTTTLNSAPVSPEWTTVTYDSLNRVTKRKTPDNAEVSSNYTGNTVTVTDQSGRKRKSVTDALGRTKKVYEDPEGPNALNYLTSYEYDTQDNLISVSQGGQTRTFVYDSLKRLVSATNPESCDQQGNPIPVSYQYDDNHNVLVRTDARNVSLHYAYDALNRPVRRWYNSSNSLTATTNNSPALPAGIGAPVEVNYFYDGKGITPQVPNSMGRLTKVASSVSNTLYTEFDSMGRVKTYAQVTDGQTYGMGYDYDLSGNMTSETYPSGRTILTQYDAAGRIAGVKNAGTGAYYAGGQPTDAANRIQYAPHGGIGSLRLGNGLWENTIFNSLLQPTEIRLGTTLGSIDRLKLAYDYGTTLNNGNVQSHTITVPTIGSTPGFTVTQNYGYDPLNRLLTAQEMNGANQQWRQSYSYDRFGNRQIDLSSDQYGVRTTSNVAPAAGDNPTISTANNRYSANQGYGYDNAGNLTAAPNKSFEYDADNHQVSFDANPQTQEKDATYSYDGDGRRVKKVDAGGTTIFVYNLIGQLIAEYTTAQQSNSGVSYLTSDPLGTPRVITDGNGNVESRHDYLPFGEELTVGRNSDYVIDNVRQKFTSKERDSESKLDYFLARYYSSTHGRFTGVDPLLASAKPIMPQSWNRYAYCNNNPLFYIDPTGLDWYHKKGNNQPEWHDDNPGDGYEPWTDMNYYAGEGHGWVHLNRYAGTFTEGWGSIIEAASRGRTFAEEWDEMVSETLAAFSFSHFRADLKADLRNLLNNPLGRDALGDPAFISLAGAGLLSQAGSEANAADQGSTTLYRAVLNGELDDIAAAGMRYRLGPNSYGTGTKGFWASADEAATFSQKMFKTFPSEGPYTITSTNVPNSFLRGAQFANDAGVGRAIYVRPPPGPVKVFNFSPNANLRFRF